MADPELERLKADLGTELEADLSEADSLRQTLEAKIGVGYLEADLKVEELGLEAIAAEMAAEVVNTNETPLIRDLFSGLQLGLDQLMVGSVLGKYEFCQLFDWRLQCGWLW